MRRENLLFIPFSLFTVVFFFLILEGSARLYDSWTGHLNEYEQVVENQGFKTDNKAKGEKRIFILGESAVQGIPYSLELSFPGFLSRLMSAGGFPHVKVVNLGVKGRHSFYQREIGDLFVKYKADAVVIYAGNNDTRDFSNVVRDVPLAWVDFKLTWNSFFYAGLKRKVLSLQEAVNKRSQNQVFVINHNIDDVWHWSDHYIRKKKLYMENPRKGLERKKIALQDFENNLLALVRYLQRKEIPVYVSNLGINLNYAPGISDVKKGLGPRGKGYEIYYQGVFVDENSRREWELLYGKAQELLKLKDYARALELLGKAETYDPSHAQTVFGLGQAYEGLALFAEAKEKFLMSKELEIQSPGGSPSKNKALARITEKTRSTWIPIQETLESMSPSGITGDDFFLDHCHFNAYGNKIVASRIMQSLCETGYLPCKETVQWQDWFTKISEGGLDDINLAKEYMMNAFYLINGTEWDSDGEYPKAVYYLEKAMSLDPKNEKIYPLLAEAYWHLGKKGDAEKVLLQAKARDTASYEEILQRIPALAPAA